MLLLLFVLSPEPQKDMGLEDEQRMLTGPGDPKEEGEELVDPLTTVREQCEQLEKCVKARERLELCDERASSRSHRQRRTAQRSSLTSCMQGTTVWPINCLTA